MGRGSHMSISEFDTATNVLTFNLTTYPYGNCWFVSLNNLNFPFECLDFVYSSFFYNEQKM